MLDCAPTAESLRFISMPSTLDWYIKHVFPMDRRLMKAARPLLNRLAPIEMPSDKYFGNIQELFNKIEGIDTLLEDPQVTSARLVTNPEKMVLRETQRAFVYFSLHGLTVDNIIVNRVLPQEIEDPFFKAWLNSQRGVLDEIEAYFAPVPVRRLPLSRPRCWATRGWPRWRPSCTPKARTPPRSASPKGPTRLPVMGKPTRCGSNCRLPRRAKSGYLKRMMNLSWRWEHSGVTSGCLRPWPLCRR